MNQREKELYLREYSLLKAQGKPFFPYAVAKDSVMACVVLLILTFVMSLTGYLLPFDQRSYWATVVGVNINGTGPLVGPFLSDFLRGGAEFGSTTLSRFYAIHMLLVPGGLAALIGAHLYLVARLGTTAPPWVRAEAKPKSLRTEKVKSGVGRNGS